METEELIKLVDGIYKNILDKFNPGARQMINAGKAYLKALHGAAAASRLYVDAIAKLAKQAQQGTWGGSSDVGSALMRIVEVYKEIQEQQMNILKAFYVDLLVPLETNLEKDTKVVQSEQKKFLQQHKQRSETYSKAAAMMKKQRKKSRGSTKTGIAMDKELKNMQVLEEEKTKLDAFCEQSLKTAMTQERRRYGFVLERQCSLAKHYLSYHSHGVNIYQQNISEWDEVAKTREFLPEAVENMFTNRLRQVTFWQDEDVYSNPRSPQLEDDRMSITSQLRKTKSMDASCLDIRSIGDATSPLLSLSRAKSEYNLTSSSPSLQDINSPQRRPKSMALPTQGAPQWDIPLAKALYAYLSSGENQLSFLEGDMIALMGERTKGWQFGENLRTHTSGWFPLAYTEIIDDPTIVGFSSPTHRSDMSSGPNGLNLQTNQNAVPAAPTTTAMSPGPQNLSQSNHHGNSQQQQQPQSLEATPTQRMFGDTLHLHRNSAKQIRRVTSNNNYIPPPALPAPVPTPQIPFQPKAALTQSQSTTFTSQNYPSLTSFPPTYTAPGGLKTSTSSFNFSTNQSSGYSTHPQGARPPPMPPLPLHLQGKKTGVGVGNVSLHSSNDSGFSNDPPPQPEVDYSDDENSGTNAKVPIRTSKNDPNNNNKREMNNLQNSQKPLQNTSKFIQSSHPNLRDPNGTLRSMIDDSIMESTKNSKIKRTKSFWRFRRSNSEEILEGMAMWKHRDLVDPLEQSVAQMEKIQNQPKPAERKNISASIGSRSIDSDRTMLAKEFNGENMEDMEIYGTSNQLERIPNRRVPSFKREQPKLSLPRNNTAEYSAENSADNFDEDSGNSMVQDDFYDDDGDGLMRTVNRKSILQQYVDSDDPNSETESEIITSDDPYDCIVVNDHTTKKKRLQMEKMQKNIGNAEKFQMQKNGNAENFQMENQMQNFGEKRPNVAEIGKKLEKLSKSSKFNPKESSLEKFNNSKNLELSGNISAVSTNEEVTIRGYSNRNLQNRPPSPAQRRSFHTFGIPDNEKSNGKSSNFQNENEDDFSINSDGEKRVRDSKNLRNFGDGDFRDSRETSRGSREVSKETRDSRDSRDFSRGSREVSKETRDSRDSRDFSRGTREVSKETRDSRDSRDFSRGSREITNETRDFSRDSRDSRDFSRDSRDSRDFSRDSRDSRDFSKGSREVSKDSRDFSRDSQEVSREPRDTRDFSRGSREVSRASGDLREVSRDSRNFSRDSKEVSSDSRGVSNDSRKFSTDSRNFSRNTREISNDSRDSRTPRYYRESSTDTNNSDIILKEDKKLSRNFFRDEYGEESRQFLPRTKLVKSSQTVMKFEKQEIYDFNGSLKKDNDKDKGYEEINNGNPNHNTYGPWYDLWGLDATTNQKK